MMSKLLKRPKATCFYCNSQVDPKDPRNFRCRECGCWNRYDARGEIMSDEPAMHDEKLNVKSFARRASPRKDRLPTTYGQALFCRTCQTNQMLVSNLLSNYLPSPDDPEYASRSALFDEYRESVEARYPPICADCLPAVEEEIKKRDHMARTSALGGFLQTSKGKGKQRQVAISEGEREKLDRQLSVWRIRGALWVVTLLMSLATHVAVLQYTLHRIPKNIAYSSPLLVLFSIIWTAWDPTYASIRKARLQGRMLRQRGKQEYNVMQMATWLSRLVTSLYIVVLSYRSGKDFYGAERASPSLPIWYSYLCLFVEFIALVVSAIVLRLERPPPVRLVEKHSKRPSSFNRLPQHSSVSLSRTDTPISTAPADGDILASLTLSNHPVLTRAASLPANPIFGLPSFSSPSGPTALHNGAPDPNSSAMWIDDGDDDAGSQSDRDPNAMDWSPASPLKGVRQNVYASDDTALLRPQRFFAPEEPTGLEHLFAKTIKLDDGTRAQHDQSKARAQWKAIVPWLPWIAGAILFVATATAAALKWWDTRQRLHQLHMHSEL